MGKKTESVKSPDYAEVISTIEHHLQHDRGVHPYESHEEAARASESGDAWRALIEIGAALDKAKRGNREGSWQAT